MGAHGEEGQAAARTRPDQDDLLPEIYDQLRALARQMMGRERPGHTLQATALVHEAYLRLSRDDPERWRDRRHFYYLAAQAMRRILVERARRRATERHGPGYRAETLDEARIEGVQEDLELVNVDDALSRLFMVDARAARLVTLRFFGGLTVAEAADVLGVSEMTARRDWKYAQAWLHRQMHGQTHEKPTTP